MVEFALVAPIALVLFFGVIIISVAALAQVQLSHAARDIARAGAVCGSATRDPATELPDGTPCTGGAFLTWASAQLQRVPGGGTPQAPAISGANCATESGYVLCVYDSQNHPITVGTTNPLDLCVKGAHLEVSAALAQPLFVPPFDRIFGGGPGGTRALTSDTEVLCEQ